MSKEKQRHTSFGDLLMINYYAPPVHVAGAIRLFHFQNEAQKYFKRISVLTSANVHLMRQDPDLETGNPNLHFIPTLDLRRIQLLRKKRTSPHLSTSLKSNRFIQFLQRLADSFPFSLILADGGLWYIWKAYQKGKRLVKGGRITHIFSSFRPMADHWVAFLLKRKYPHLFWIADFRDLPIDTYRKNVIWPKLQYRFHRFILKKADLSTTVSEGLREKIQKLHTQVYLLPNGIGKYNPTPAEIKPHNKFTVTYTGSLYPTLQRLDSFLEVLQQLKSEGVFSEDNIRLIYAGKDGAYWDRMVEQFGLNRLNRTLGLRSYREAKQLQFASHVNLLLTWSHSENHGILTAKLFDYLEAGQPIIAIVNGQRDLELERILRESGLGEAIYPLGEVAYKEIRRVLVDLYEDSNKGGEGRINNFEKLKPFFWEENMRGLGTALQLLYKNQAE